MEYIPECPACGSNYAVYIGRLGKLTHLRCRDCGIGYSTEEEITFNDEQEAA